jgi:sRNA-binding protein
VAPAEAARAGADVSAAGSQVIAASSDRAISNAKSNKAQTESQRRWHAWRKLSLDVLAVLSELFPAVFRPPNFRPLKLKIHLDLIERAPVTAEEVHVALSIHCHRLSYLRVQVEGAERVDLDGNPVGVVTAEQAIGAKSAIASIRKRLKERRAAARAALKPEPPTPIEARGGPADCSGLHTAPKATKPASGRPDRPIIGLGGGWKRGAP